MNSSGEGCTLDILILLIVVLVMTINSNSYICACVALGCICMLYIDFLLKFESFYMIINDFSEDYRPTLGVYIQSIRLLFFLSSFSSILLCCLNGG